MAACASVFLVLSGPNRLLDEGRSLRTRAPGPLLAVHCIGYSAFDSMFNCVLQEEEEEEEEEEYGEGGAGAGVAVRLCADPAVAERVYCIHTRGEGRAGY